MGPRGRIRSRAGCAPASAAPPSPPQSVDEQWSPPPPPPETNRSLDDDLAAALSAALADDSPAPSPVAEPAAPFAASEWSPPAFEPADEFAAAPAPPPPPPAAAPLPPPPASLLPRRSGSPSTPPPTLRWRPHLPLGPRAGAEATTTFFRERLLGRVGTPPRRHPRRARAFGVEDAGMQSRRLRPPPRTSSATRCFRRRPQIPRRLAPVRVGRAPRLPPSSNGRLRPTPAPPRLRPRKFRPRKLRWRRRRVASGPAPARRRGTSVAAPGPERLTRLGLQGRLAGGQPQFPGDVRRVARALHFPAEVAGCLLDDGDRQPGAQTGCTGWAAGL